MKDEEAQKIVAALNRIATSLESIDRRLASVIEERTVVGNQFKRYNVVLTEDRSPMTK